MQFEIKNDLRCFFIDNKIHIMSKDEIIEDEVENELEFLNNEVKKI